MNTSKPTKQGTPGRIAPPSKLRRLRGADEAAQRLSVVDIVRKAAWHGALPQTVQTWIEARLTEHTVRAGQYLGHRGEIPSAWFGLVEGVLKSSVFSADGRTSSLGGILPGCWFGEGALLRGKPRHADYVALRDSRVALLAMDDFVQLLQTQAAFKDFILMQIVERLHYFMDHVGDGRLMQVPAQVANTLCGLMHPLNNPLRQLQLPISQDEIAAIAGVSRQRCNQTLSHMQEQGWLCIRYGGLTLIAPDRIAELARGG